MAKVNFKSNKTRTPIVGAIFKAQKAQNLFLEKNLKFLNFFRKMSQCRKMEKGDPVGLLTYILLQNIKKLEGPLRKTRRDPYLDSKYFHF